ncbi:hypothetical protein L7F22_008123 [Adiantum nelumboides]|nr:hypothetical protein [Adiantum nelumboides]
MGDAMTADGAFVGQDVSISPLIGKLSLHIQGYVDKEDFFISPLKHEDVILGAQWFDHLAASINFPENFFICFSLQSSGCCRGRKRRVLKQNDVEEEVESQTLDALGIAQQEASLMIVPYVVRPEVPSVEPSNEENKIYMDMGEDILQKTRMFSCHHCPPIPLCRLIPYARVRGLRDDLSGLKIAFSREGYVAEKGAFTVSIWTRDKEVSIVDESVQRDWDPIWHEVQISKALNKKVEEARLKMSDEELRLFEEKENEELASRYGDRIGKDFVYEDHVRYGIALAASTLVDLGWLLVMVSMAGDCIIGWIERYVRVYDLEIVRQVVVIHHSTYGFKEIGGLIGYYYLCCLYSMSMLFMVRRQAVDPPIFIAESTPLFESFGMHPLDTLIYHYLPDDLRALDPVGQQWRGGLERSRTFLACFVHMYCRRGGVCIEMGCGTVPITKTCMHIGRVRASIDVDIFLMTSYVEPLLLAYMQQGSHDDVSRPQADDEVDPLASFNPYD